MSQKTIWNGISIIVWVFAGALLVGTIAGAWDDVLTVVTPRVALIGTILLVGFLIIAEVYLRQRALSSETEDGNIEVYSTLPLHLKWGIVGMLIMLWLPVLAQFAAIAPTDPMPQSADEASPTAILTPASTPESIVLIARPQLEPEYYRGRCYRAWEKIVGLTGEPAYLTLNANIDGNTEFAVRNQAEWRPNFPVAGKYKVEAFIPSHSFTTWDCMDYEPDPRIHYPEGNTFSAHYEVYQWLDMQDLPVIKTVVVDQTEASGDWVELGEFSFGQNSENFVRLLDGTYEEELTRLIVFGAMRFTKLDE